MSSSESSNLIIQKHDLNGHPVTVLRFAHGNLNHALVNDADIEVSPLYMEIDKAVLGDAVHGESLILNFGLVEVFNSAFYRLLLKLREIVLEKDGQVVLCNPSPSVRQVFDLFATPRLFDVTDTEQEALAKLKP